MSDAADDPRNHVICEQCWQMWYPGRWPTIVRDDPEGGPILARMCCGCNMLTWRSIFTREREFVKACHHEFQSLSAMENIFLSAPETADG